MLDWARKCGMKAMMHCGGQSMPQGTTTTLEDVLQINPDVVSHINGGPIAIRLEDIEVIIRDTNLYFDIVVIGNPKARVKAIEWAQEYNALHRVMIGSDCVSGFGILPYGILRTVVDVASLNDIAPEVALSLATGNTAKCYGLEKVGTIALGKEADLVIMDAALGSVGVDALESISLGDVPGVSMVMVDGEVKARRGDPTPWGDVTPAPKRRATIA